MTFESKSQKGAQNTQKSIRFIGQTHMAFRHVEKPYKHCRKWRLLGGQKLTIWGQSARGAQMFKGGGEAPPLQIQQGGAMKKGGGRGAGGLAEGGPPSPSENNLMFAPASGMRSKIRNKWK